MPGHSEGDVLYDPFSKAGSSMAKAM